MHGWTLNALTGNMCEYHTHRLPGENWIAEIYGWRKEYKRNAVHTMEEWATKNGGELSLLVSRHDGTVHTKWSKLFSVWSIERTSSECGRVAATADRNNQFHRDAMCRNMKKNPRHSVIARQHRGGCRRLVDFLYAKRLFSYFPSFFSGGWFPHRMCCRCRLLIVKCTNGTIPFWRSIFSTGEPGFACTLAHIRYMKRAKVATFPRKKEEWREGERIGYGEEEIVL